MLSLVDVMCNMAIVQLMIGAACCLLSTCLSSVPTGTVLCEEIIMEGPGSSHSSRENRNRQYNISSTVIRNG